MTRCFCLVTGHSPGLGFYRRPIDRWHMTRTREPRSLSTAHGLSPSKDVMLTVTGSIIDCMNGKSIQKKPALRRLGLGSQTHGMEPTFTHSRPATSVVYLMKSIGSTNIFEASSLREGAKPIAITLNIETSLNSQRCRCSPRRYAALDWPNHLGHPIFDKAITGDIQLFLCWPTISTIHTCSSRLQSPNSGLLSPLPRRSPPWRSEAGPSTLNNQSSIINNQLRVSSLLIPDPTPTSAQPLSIPRLDRKLKSQIQFCRSVQKAPVFISFHPIRVQNVSKMAKNGPFLIQTQNARNPCAQKAL